MASVIDKPLAPAAGRPREVLGLREAVAIIVGIVIGAGIFKAPSLVATFTGDPAWMFGAWALGGLISLIGALCYAELATAYPDAGGDYHFLHRAFGGPVSFLFAWARFAVINTGAIALLGFVFGDYASQILPIGRHGSAVYAAISIVLLTWINVRGMRSGAAFQTWLTTAEVGGLVLIIVAGLFLASNGAGAGVAPAAPAAASSGMPPMFGLAMVFVLFTYSGWNEAAYISAELKDERHNMVKALVISIALITVLYLLVNWAYLHGLGLKGMAESKAVAADLLGAAFGPTGATLMALMVAIAALTSINATMIVGARTTFALGRDWPPFARLAEWDEVRGTPINALLVQGVLALGYVAIGASTMGEGFKAIIELTSPVFWFFILLVGIALFVLRAKEPQAPRPFRVPLYPLTPLVFCLTSAYMLWRTVDYALGQKVGGLNAGLIGLIVLALGALLRLALGRGAGATR